MSYATNSFYPHPRAVMPRQVQGYYPQPCITQHQLQQPQQQYLYSQQRLYQNHLPAPRPMADRRQQQQQQQPDDDDDDDDNEASGSAEQDSQQRPPPPPQKPIYFCLFPTCTPRNIGFARKADLQRHVATTHNQAIAERFDCEFENCHRRGGLGFTRRDKLIEHVREVHGVKPSGSQGRGRTMRM